MHRIYAYLNAVAALACVTAGIAIAQEARSPVADAQQARSQVTENQGSPTAGRLDDKTTGSLIRASELIGTDIENNQGQDLGEIEDIVIDARTGKIRYAAVTYGGFLGLGDKLFAVPFEAFQVKVEAEDRGETGDDVDYVLVLNVTQQQLEGQQGFDEDKWPNMADESMARSLDQRYGIERDENGNVRRAARERLERNR